MRALKELRRVLLGYVLVAAVYSAIALVVYCIEMLKDRPPGP